MTSAFVITLGNQPPLDREARQARARRARELLDGASWVFDEFMTDENRALLESNSTDEREDHHRNIRAAAEIKGRLMQIVQAQEAQETIDGRKHRTGASADDE